MTAKDVLIRLDTETVSAVGTYLDDGRVYMLLLRSWPLSRGDFEIRLLCIEISDFCGVDGTFPEKRARLIIQPKTELTTISCRMQLMHHRMPS